MALQFHNTLGNKKEVFKPINEGEVRMYTCGPTVYDFAHIGNFRTYIFEDLLRRYLKYKGYRVIQVMNLTDVDDKTIRGARREKISLGEYTARFKQAFFEDIDTLGIERAEVYPEATKHIPEMVELIKRLMAKGFAYRAEDGSIYFRISSFLEYGKLSGKILTDLKPTGRVRADEYTKEEVSDFALWKAWDEEDGDVWWETELGRGRPGWHIECSAMSIKYLGETFDIHTGGIDNIFPHHENEIAQSESATGKKFVNYWLHSAHLIVEGKKMSKSLGNYYTLRDLLNKGFNPLAIRYLLISTHYRVGLNFTFEALKSAGAAIDRLAELLHTLDHFQSDSSTDNPDIERILEEIRQGFESSLDDDLNISPALASIFEGIKRLNKLIRDVGLSVADAMRIRNLLFKLDTVLGILPETKVVDSEIERLVARRDIARKNKDYAEADKIREELNKRGIIIEDTPKGTIWRRKI